MKEKDPWNSTHLTMYDDRESRGCLIIITLPEYEVGDEVSNAVIQKMTEWGGGSLALAEFDFPPLLAHLLLETGAPLNRDFPTSSMMFFPSS
jgi:hypothetical protein